MKNRTEAIWTRLEALVSERRDFDSQQADSIIESHAEVILPVFHAALLSCNERALQLQTEGEKGETVYIALSFLGSSVLTGAYDLRMDFYDEKFLADISEACAYCSYGFLIPPYQESMDALWVEAKRHFTRLMDYEKEALAWKYEDEVLREMVKTMCSYCLRHPDTQDVFSKLSLTEDCAITFGRFLQDQRVLMKIPSSKEVLTQ